MEELLENLLFSALFPVMDDWRRYDTKDPPDPVIRVFVRMEMRLTQRYGSLGFWQAVTPLLRKRDLPMPALQALWSLRSFQLMNDLTPN